MRSRRTDCASCKNWSLIRISTVPPESGRGILQKNWIQERFLAPGTILAPPNGMRKWPFANGASVSLSTWRRQSMPIVCSPITVD
jgi:hypothetical protein